MTTITNFIQGNFINNSTVETQRPVWVVDGNGIKIRDIKCGKDKKPLIRLDLGLGTMKFIGKDVDIVKSQFGVQYAKLHADRPSYIVKNDIKERSKENFLLYVLSRIEKDVSSSQILKKDKEHTMQGWGLLVEGLQTYSILTKNKKHSQSDMQSFVGALSSLSPHFRQIVIVSHSKNLSRQVNFALERISTCLTKFTQKDDSQDIWNCTSTIRRYTGYFKQQLYILQLKDGRVKVSKPKQEKKEDKTQMHTELFEGLGFKAQKDEVEKRKTQELKQMIFPHLKVQNKCEKINCKKECMCNQPVPEDLIVLDEEQEDQDDVDV